MPRRVSRRHDNAQAPPAVLERVSLADVGEVGLFHGVVLAHGRVLQEAYLLLGKAQHGVFLRPVRVRGLAELLQARAVLAADVDLRAGRGQLRG